nr:terminase small subunit [Gluconacetobacter sacchari]
MAARRGVRVCRVQRLAHRRDRVAESARAQASAARCDDRGWRVGVTSLNDKQRRFVEEYLVDLNATQAAIRAGYSEKTARSQGQRMLTNVDIQKCLSEGQAARATRTKITQDRVVQEIARLGLSDVRKLFDDSGRLLQPHEWDDDTAAAVAAIEVDQRKEPGEDGERYTVTKIKAWDKNSALEKLMKHLGLYERDNEQRQVIVNIRDDLDD